MHSVLGRMRDITTLTSDRIVDDSLPEFSVNIEDNSLSASEFLVSEIARYKSIEKEIEVSKEVIRDSKKMEHSKAEEKKTYTRSRGQKSLFEFGSEEKSDPWKPILDGSDDLNRQ